MVQGSAPGTVTRALSPYKTQAAASEDLKASEPHSDTAIAEKKGVKRRKARDEEYDEEQAGDIAQTESPAKRQFDRA